MPKFLVTEAEWKLMQELMFNGSNHIAWGTYEWKAYNELREKLKAQALG